MGAEAHFRVVEQEAELRKVLLEAFCMKSDGRGVKESCCRHSLPPECTFLFEIFFFLRSIGDVRSSTFDHSARLEPAIPGFLVLISRISSGRRR